MNTNIQKKNEMNVGINGFVSNAIIDFNKPSHILCTLGIICFFSYLVIDNKNSNQR